MEFHCKSTTRSVGAAFTRQFQAFEWAVRNVHALRDFVEHGQIANPADGPEEPHEVLRESPMLGDGKFKLEIGAVFRGTVSPPAYICESIKCALQTTNLRPPMSPPRSPPLLLTKNILRPSSTQRPAFRCVSLLSC